MRTRARTTPPPPARWACASFRTRTTSWKRHERLRCERHASAVTALALPVCARESVRQLTRGSLPCGGAATGRGDHRDVHSVYGSGACAHSLQGANSRAVCVWTSRQRSVPSCALLSQRLTARQVLASFPVARLRRSTLVVDVLSVKARMRSMHRAASASERAAAELTICPLTPRCHRNRRSFRRICSSRSCPARATSSACTPCSARSPARAHGRACRLCTTASGCARRRLREAARRLQAAAPAA